MNRKRVILTSCSIILLCTAIIVGMTFALFSEQMKLTNHLKAGELSITLTRTNLKYSTLDGKGYLKEVVVEKDEDFTASNSANKNSSPSVFSKAIFILSSLALSTMV